jgi:hypothetical protein
MNEDRTITIGACVFGGRYVVSFEPRSIAWPSLEFRTYDEAKVCADVRHAAHGWPIVDNAEGGA